MVALALREETSPELEREVDELHWISLGQLGTAIDILQRSGAREAVMAGQVQHRQIFSDIVPDLKLLGVLARLALRNTDSLIGAVAEALAREGITLLPSVAFLEDQLALPGPMTKRRPDADEQKDVAYGESVARTLAGMDLGQTAVVKGPSPGRAPRSSRWRSRSRTCDSTCPWWGRARSTRCARPARGCWRSTPPARC